MASTAIGNGIAIPHVRNPIVLHITEPIVSLCFLEKPVDFNSLDGKPVTCLFTLISPTVKAHLYLLSRLAFALQDDSFRKTIEKQSGREEIFSQIARIESSLQQNQVPLNNRQEVKCHFFFGSADYLCRRFGFAPGQSKAGFGILLGCAGAVSGSVIAVIPAFKVLFAWYYRVISFELEHTLWFFFHPDRPYIGLVFNTNTWLVCYCCRLWC